MTILPNVPRNHISSQRAVPGAGTATRTATAAKYQQQYLLAETLKSVQTLNQIQKTKTTLSTTTRSQLFFIFYLPLTLTVVMVIPILAIVLILPGSTSG